jgi:hypothetical protein
MEPVYHLVEFSNILIHIRCYYITKDAFVSLGTPFCPKFVPKCDLCLPARDFPAELNPAIWGEAGSVVWQYMAIIATEERI